MKKLLNIITAGKYQKFKTLFIITIYAYIAFGILMPSIIYNVDSEKTMKMFLISNIFIGCALIIEAFYYLMKFSPLKKSIKLSAIDGSLKYIAEITEKDFDSNGYIAFSDHFFYDLKTNFFVAYTSIAWVYYKDGGVVIRTMNGKKFRSRIDYDNLGALMKAYPQIMNGYNSNNYKEYIARVTVFNSRITPSAETIVFSIPNAINNFWNCLGCKVKPRVFYTIAYTCIALFFIGLIVFAIIGRNIKIPDWVFIIWASLVFIALFCVWLAHKVKR